MKPRFAGIVALLLVITATALTVISIAWPGYSAAMAFLPVDTAIKNYYTDRVIPADQLDGLIKRANTVIGLNDHYRYHDGLSILYYMRGLDSQHPASLRRSSFEQSISEAEKALALAPARPMTWLRTARTRALLGQATDKVISSWKMSIYTGRVEPTLLIGRLELGFTYRAFLDDEALILLREQTLLAWKLQARALANAIREQRVSWQGVAELLGDSDERIVKEMEASIVR